MQGEWRDLLGIYSGFLQETTNYDGEFRNFNPVGLISEPCNQNVVAPTEKIPSFTRDLVAATEKNPSFNRNVGSFEQDYGNDSEVWKNNPLAELLELRSSIPNKYVGIESNFIETESASSIFAKQDCLSGSNQRNNCFGLSQLYTDGFPVPHDRNYNINSPPRSEADATSSTTNSFQFAPETPDQQKQLQNHRLSEILNFLVDDHSSQESDRHENLAISIRNEDIENRCDELLQNIVDSSSAAAVSILTEKKFSDEGNEQQGIDLSETPEPKPTKRRKHRPKVIREEKPKKNQKLTPPKINTPNQNPLVKRKYVRKNKLKLSETQQTSAVNEAKSCKRALNFDLENGTSDEKHQQSVRDFDLNLDYQDTELSNGVNSKSEMPATELSNGVNSKSEMPAVQIGQQSESMKQARTACNASLSKNQMPSGCTSLPETNFPTTPPAKGRHHTLNIIARNLSMRNVDPCQNVERIGIGQLTNIDANALLDFDGKRGFKRGHYHGVEQMHPHMPNRSHSPILCQEMFRGTGNRSYSNNFNEASLETNKRRKTGNGPHRTICTEPAADKDCSRRDETGGMNVAYAHKDTSLVDGGVLNSYFERENDPTLASKHNFQNQQVSSEVHHIHRPAFHYLQKIGTYSANKSAKKKTMEQTLSNQGGTDKVHHQRRKEVSGDYKNPSKKTRGTDKQKFPVSIDDITYQLKCLRINGQANKIVGQEQHALVPYEGGGTIILYEAFDPIKKRKSRPKVDLDPETERIWKLLMGIEGSEGTEATDKKKEKWWENEREVFRGRAESFIARMHLVQGDRRFSQWKGSVVDSVIGVFLTQNVSDHLSSSAFMSLAAKFPLQSTNINQTGYPNRTTILVEEPDIQILEPGGGIKCHEKIGIDNLSSRTRTAASEHNRSHGSTTPINLLQMGNATISNGFYSRLNSSLLDVRSTNRDQQSENAENLKGSSSYTHPINLRDSIVSSGSFQLNMTPGSQSLGVGCFNGLGEEIVSPLPSDASGFVREKGVNQLSNRLGHIAESTSRTSARYNGMISFQSPTVSPYPYLNKHATHQGNLRLGPQTENYQHFINNHQLEGTFSTEPIRPAEVRVQWQTNARQRASNDLNFTGQSFTTERTSIKEQIDYPGKPRSGTETNISNARKMKAEGEKGKAFDWDSLRKQAQSNGKRRERSQDTMDSLNYEAIRCADVKEISNSIKERGMNNMLAERIKDFLNRMVREHGSIDLEWLRDVPPDKAKDYLLSVRGLGLKSVECVRLLTLHHLAFPVDTNVGRIAVRLGWVPLQPLPESLQLHLLELYPVLETIQKYLWPRLCKLDQRTLYELHYQMITFGKVFCTKSKPNCNACPMRGECRHFASAFASARLALPGPEERSIVSSVAPIAADRNPAVVTKHMPLALAGNNPNQGGIIDRRYEPVVEEPATPEPETTEVLGSDIEDAFYEDTDEIPMIKLNTEEFILNLHNYMQDNMELQEADMSKALVALNPEAASIPTPKLKNVSRLRTEHQVYQLPDSHPLLNGLDKREDDDPSPYLLAIWTPGETASSVQPPESTCQAHGSAKLCNNKTCFTCNSTREANAQTVRGTLLIPCRTAMRGSFPLNGTYFQVNEMFADHESSLNPIDVPRAWIWNLPRRTVYFGTSVSTIFKGLSTEGIQYCFWRGFVCVRGFEQKTRSPRPLMSRLHFPASKLVKTKNEEKSKVARDSKRIPSYGPDHDLSVQR